MDYSSDRPITTKEEDAFRRWPFAKRIADTLATRADAGSLVIGLYGPWGDGKTSTLRLMRTSLADHTNVIAIEFNPWFFESDERLLRGFFETLAASIDSSLQTGKETIGKLLKDYGSLLSTALPGLGGVAENVGQALSTVELGELRRRLEGLLRDTGKRIVVLIDDIDRLNRKEIQSIFKLVKLSASFDYTSYVVAFDDQIVAAALGEGYGAGDASAGRSFLEKIVQVPLYQPPPDEFALREMVFAGVAEALSLSKITLTDDHARTFANHFAQGLQPALATPRQVKLYVNALLFALPLLRREAHPVDHLLIEAIRVFYPTLYMAIRSNQDFFVKGRREGDSDDRINPQIDRCIKTPIIADGVSDWDHVRRTLLQALFPKLEGVFGRTSYGPEWETHWAREQRICSEQYFKRYFTYGIPVDDVSDMAVSNLIEVASGESDIQPLLSDFAAHNVIRRVIEKLRGREMDISLSAIPTVVLAVSRNGTLLPRERGPLVGDWTIMQAGILIADLLKRITAQDRREELAHEVLEVVEPPSFGVECLRWIRLPEEKPESDRIVSKDCEDSLGRILAARIKSRAENMPPYREFPSDAQHLLWVWRRFGPVGEVGSYLRGRFEANSAELDEFLAAFSELSLWRTEDVLFPHSYEARRSYDAVVDLVAPEFILFKLKELHGEDLDNPSVDNESRFSPPRLIAHKFAQIHNAVEAAKASPPVSDPDQPPAN